MRNKHVLEAAAVGLAMLTLIWTGHIGCKKTESPFGVNAPNGLDVPSPTPNINLFYVSVQDLDKPSTVANGFAAVTVYAVEPNNSVTLMSLTGSNGTASITNSVIPPGTWRIIVPGGQGSFPFSTSFVDVPITASGQTVTMACGQTSLTLIPTNLTTYYSESGAIFTYNLTYNQPNPLSIPISLIISPFPTNWISTASPVTIGSYGVTQCAVTIGGSTCLDAQPIFTITAVDSAGNTRCVSAPSTITHVFNANLLVTWTTNSTPSIDACTNCQGNDGCNIGYYPMPPFMQCSGFCVAGWLTKINVSFTNACSKSTTIAMSNYNGGGYTGCGNGAWWNASSYITDTNATANNAQTAFSGSGSNSLTIAGPSTSNPSLTFVLTNSDFPKGVTYTGTVANSGTVTMFNESNWYF